MTGKSGRGVSGLCSGNAGADSWRGGRNERTDGIRIAMARNGKSTYVTTPRTPRSQVMLMTDAFVHKKTNACLYTSFQLARCKPLMFFCISISNSQETVGRSMIFLC